MLAHRRHPTYKGLPALQLRLLCKRHLVHLRKSTHGPVPWLLAASQSPRLLTLLDSGEGSELLHQCYAYMTYGTGGCLRLCRACFWLPRTGGRGACGTRSTALPGTQ